MRRSVCWVGLCTGALLAGVPPAQAQTTPEAAVRYRP